MPWGAQLKHKLSLCEPAELIETVEKHSKMFAKQFVVVTYPLIVLAAVEQSVAVVEQLVVDWFAYFEVMIEEQVSKFLLQQVLGLLAV